MTEKRRPAAPEAGSNPDLRSPAEGAASLVLKQVKARGSWRDDVPGSRATSKLYDVKDFPTEGVFLIDITTSLEDARPSGTWATSCPKATSTNPSRYWRRWSRVTSALSQPASSCGRSAMAPPP